MLFPELVKSRIPTDGSLRSGMVNKSYSFTIPTNSSGNAGCIIFPWYAARPGWIYFLNDASFNASTWSQTPAGSGVNGPLYPGSYVTSYKVTSTSVEIHPIVSALNN